MNFLQLEPAVTLSIALLGAVLGIVNLWREFSRSRVKLKVMPRGWMDTFNQDGLCIEVVNLSEFPVTLVSFGITLRAEKKLDWLFLSIDGNHCPVRLEPRDAVSFRAKPGAEKSEQLRKFGRRAFARTACGHVASGTSPYLRGILKG